MKPLETSISVSFVLMQTVLLVTMNTGYSNSIVCARQRRRADGTCLPEYVSAYKQKQSPKLTTDSSSEAVVRNINAMIFMPNPNDSSINLDDQEMRAAALMAIDRVEKEGLISPKRYIWKKENFNFAPVGCDERKSLLQVHSWFSGQLQQNGTILADLDNGIVNLMYAIGLHCNGICRSFAQLYSAIDIPVIGTGCNSKELRDKSRESGFPYFARVIGSSEDLTVARHDFLSSHSLWTRIKILTLNDPDRLEAADQLKQYFRTANMKQTNQVSVDQQKLPKSCGEEPTIPLKEKAVYKDIKNILKAARTAYNIFILMMYDCEVIAVMVAAHELNMFSDPYIRYSFITNSFTNAKTLEKFWQGGEDIMRESIEGLISINIHRPDLPWSMYERKLRQFVLDFKNTDNEEIKLGGDLSVYSGLLFDAIYLFGQAIQYATREGKDLSYYKMGIAEFFHTDYKYTAAPSAISHSLGYDFTLATGEYVTDKYKDRISTYAVEIINNGEFLPMFIWRNNENPKLIAVKGKFKWPGNHMDAPPGQPNCPEGIVNGWTNPTCTPLPPALSMNAGEFLKRYKYALLGGLIGLVIILVGLLMIFFRKKKIEADQKKVKHWSINWRDIITEEKKDKMTETIHRVLRIEANRPMIVANNLKMGFYGQVGVVKGLVCCIAHIDKDINPSDPDLLYDLIQMNNLRHENVNQFIGICREKPHQCIVTLYGKFGSLSDIIKDGTILITTEFQLSFVTDIACGIEYLHTTDLGYHGHLKSTNIIVDNKWTCKITDFGMSMLQEWKVKTSNKSDMLYLAPELLRESPDDFDFLLGSQAGDIYAFAIIMQEISMKDIPYAIERRRKPLNEIISLIASTDLTQPFRPSIPPNSCSPSWLYVMSSCWNDDPEMRPVSKQIVQAFRRLAKGKTIYIIDIMLESLEKHTDKLERLVAQRAGELNEKQKEMETLLFKILPESAARSLIDKGFVEPEYFSLATIYFSDVVGFTKMCQTSTPIEVVSFLNAAFAVFDDVTDLYNVYKCETIRDVYMVASGLPIRNGDEHASEIATMALHLLSTVTNFKIPHRPLETLQLRIGMHTGPVVAGVVGIRMPHYCLFGDTINTAARMQTGGYALRIHMSDTTTDLLRQSENFIIELRGDIEVKGKGLMTTYWLTGKQGFNLPLPSLSLAAPMEDHYFK